ncbi:hypothetical protein Nmel_008096 [Mimus melanotis]
MCVFSLQVCHAGSGWPDIQIKHSCTK